MNALRQKKTNKSSSLIAHNRRIAHDYVLYETFQAGLALLGWEIKALRSGQITLKESYIHFYGSEAFLVGAHFTPPKQTCTHVLIQPKRNRKLLLSQKELRFLREKSERSGYTIVAKELYWKGPWVKCRICLAKGKKVHDVRASEIKRDWQRDCAQLKKNYNAQKL